MSLPYAVIPLGDLCDVLDSKRRPITKRDRVEGEFPYYGATGILGYVEDFIFDEPLVLFGEDGAKWGAGENTAFSADGRYWVNNHAHVIRPHRQKLLDAWLIYQLNHADLSPFITGLTVPKLNQAKMREIPIFVPPLDEQRRIVAVLDKAFAGIATATANAQKNLTNARALFESYLESAFDRDSGTWSSYHLGDSNLLKIIDGDRGANYPNKSDFSESGHCLFLNTKNVRPDGFNFDATMFVSKAKDDSLRKGKLSRNDVIMTTRGTIGNLALYDESVGFEHVRINSGMLIFRPNCERISPRYLFEILRSGIIKKQIAENVSGAAQPQLPIHTLVKFNIPVPNNLADQDHIVRGLPEIEGETIQLEQVYQSKLTALAELKQSLLQKAVAGELT